MNVEQYKTEFVRGTDAEKFNAKMSVAEHLEAEMDDIADQIEESDDGWERHELEMAEMRVAGQLAGVLYELQLLTESEEEARERGMVEDLRAEAEYPA